MKRWFLVPPGLVLLGIVWISISVLHYERATGRGFFRLAGHVSSWPKDVFHPRPEADAIQRWVVDVPSLVTASLLGGAGIVFTVMNRRAGIARISLWWLTVIVSGLAFFVAVSWVLLMITGAFI